MARNIFFKKSYIFRIQKRFMLPGSIWDYIGAFTLVLVFIYGTENYWITLFAGFVVFCVFLFSYGYKIPDFKLTFSSALKAVKTSAIIYIIPYLAGIIVYALTKNLNKKVLAGAA